MTFSAMVHDSLRMRSYERDIWATVRGKRVLEVGAGALAPLTKMCLAAGAAEVVAVERTAWAAEAAADLLAPHRNCRVVAADAATLTVSDVGGDGCFDVLVHGESLPHDSPPEFFGFG
jgi:predicted nicotinamide N-methyase